MLSAGLSTWATMYLENRNQNSRNRYAKSSLWSQKPWVKVQDCRLRSTSTHVEALWLRFRRELPYNRAVKPKSETPLGASKAITPPNCTSWISTSETSGHQVQTLKDFFFFFLQREIWKKFPIVFTGTLFIRSSHWNKRICSLCTKLNTEKLKYKTTVSFLYKMGKTL